MVVGGGGWWAVGGGSGVGAPTSFTPCFHFVTSSGSLCATALATVLPAAFPPLPLPPPPPPSPAELMVMNTPLLARRRTVTRTSMRLGYESQLEPIDRRSEYGVDRRARPPSSYFLPAVVSPPPPGESWVTQRPAPTSCTRANCAPPPPACVDLRDAFEPRDRLKKICLKKKCFSSRATQTRNEY